MAADELAQTPLFSSSFLSFSSSFPPYGNASMRNSCSLLSTAAFPEIALPVLASSISSTLGKLSPCLAALPACPLGALQRVAACPGRGAGPGQDPETQEKVLPPLPAPSDNPKAGNQGDSNHASAGAGR